MWFQLSLCTVGSIFLLLCNVPLITVTFVPCHVIHHPFSLKGLSFSRTQDKPLIYSDSGQPCLSQWHTVNEEGQWLTWGVSVDSNYLQWLGSGTGTEIRCYNYRMDSWNGAEGAFASATDPSTIHLKKKNDKVKYMEKEQI